MLSDTWHGDIGDTQHHYLGSCRRSVREVRDDRSEFHEIGPELDMRIAGGEDGRALARDCGQDGELGHWHDEAEAPVEGRRFFNVPHQMSDMMQAADKRSRSLSCSKRHG